MLLVFIKPLLKLRVLQRNRTDRLYLYVYIFIYIRIYEIYQSAYRLPSSQSYNGCLTAGSPRTKEFFSVRLDVPASLQYLLESRGSRMERMDFPARVKKTSRQRQSYLPSSFIVFSIGCHQKVWPTLKVCLSVSKDLDLK